MKTLIIEKYLEGHRLGFNIVVLSPIRGDESSKRHDASTTKLINKHSTSTRTHRSHHYTQRKWRWEQGIQSCGIEGAGFPCPSKE